MKSIVKKLKLSQNISKEKYEIVLLFSHIEVELLIASGLGHQSLPKDRCEEVDSFILGKVRGKIKMKKCSA